MHYSAAYTDIQLLQMVGKGNK